MLIPKNSKHNKKDEKFWIHCILNFTVAALTPPTSKHPDVNNERNTQVTSGF